MNVVMIYFYSKRFRFAPSFNNKVEICGICVLSSLSTKVEICGKMSKYFAETESFEDLRKTGVTIILTTHYIEEAEAIADRVGVINQGEIIIVDQTKELLKKDIEQIINKIPIDNEDIRNIRDKALILVGFYSFCRRSELLGMKFEHLNFEEDGIQVLIPFSKTDQKGEGRMIYLPKNNTM